VHSDGRGLRDREEGVRLGHRGAVELALLDVVVGVGSVTDDPFRDVVGKFNLVVRVVDRLMLRDVLQVPERLPVASCLLFQDLLVVSSMACESSWISTSFAIGD
jgi:hypothetical protein